MKEKIHAAETSLFVITLVLAGFVAGMYVYKEKVFPYSLFRDAWNAGLSLFYLHISEPPVRHKAPSEDVTPDSEAQRLPV